MRAVAQLVSYEIPVGMAVAGVVLWTGTLDLHANVSHRMVAACDEAGVRLFVVNLTGDAAAAISGQSVGTQPRRLSSMRNVRRS